MPRPIPLAVLLLALVLVAGGSPASGVRAAELSASTTQQLIDAITTANTNGEADTITLAAGTYELTLPLPDITSEITIVGAGAGATIIDGPNTHQHVFIGSAGNLTLDGLTLTGGRGLIGGSISNEGTLTITNSTLTDNIADWTGGSMGGGIFNREGTVTIANSTFSENSAISGSGTGNGGGIFNDGGTVTITNSTFSQNIADGRGGGIYNNFGTLTITNSTFSQNAAPFGGGIYNDGTVTITNSTFSENDASTFGGGIHNNVNSTVTISNSIVAGSPSGGNCAGVGTWGPESTNNISDTAACPASAGFDVGVVALGGLQFNDGSTETHALLPTSGAINAGDQATCDAITPNTDQRGPGFPRTVGGRCDIGAFELQQGDADLSLTKTAEPLAVPAGETVTYTLSVANAGPGGATGVTVTDALPAGVTYVSNTCGAPEPVGGVFTWDAGTLDAESDATCTIDVLAPESPGSFTNSASVSSAATDPNPGDNDASATARVVVPDLHIDKEGPDVTSPETEVVYVVTVTNNGEGEARGVVITDELRGGSLDHVEAPSGVECEQSGDTVTCTLEGSLPPGGEIVIRVHTVAPATRGTTGMLNEACVTTATPGDDAGDNCDGVGTTVIANVAIPPLPAVGSNAGQPEPPQPSRHRASNERAGGNGNADATGRGFGQVGGRPFEPLTGAAVRSTGARTKG